MNRDRLVCVGLSHQTASVELREQLSQWPSSDLRTNVIEELVILNTCNRLELYAYLAEDVLPANQAQSVTTILYQPLIDLIATTQQISPTEFIDHLHYRQGEAVIHHLCRVAAGLESIVMGEGQILGQVNGALQQAYNVKSAGPVLGLLFRTGIKAGKRARTETQISTHPVSVSSAAITLAAQLTGLLHRQRVAVIGMGEIGQLALKGLSTRGVKQLNLVNRTLQHAEQMAALYGGTPHSMAELPTVLAQADIVITATSASEPVLTVEIINAAMAEREVNENRRPLTLIDLAVPRDIDPDVAAIHNVALHDVDDLRAVVDEAMAARHAEIPFVETIIAELLEEWHKEADELRLRPVVVELRQQAEQIRRRTVERTLHYLERQQGAVDEQTAEQLRYLSRALVNQLLHEPTNNLKRSASQPEGTAYAALVCDLFGLDVDIPNEAINRDPTYSFDFNSMQLFDDGMVDGGCPHRISSGDNNVAFCTSFPQYELTGQP